MSRTSILLLPNSQDQLLVTGAAVRADAFGGRKSRLYTVAIHTSAFLGTVHVEAAVVVNPSDADWFAAIDPVLFEADPMAPLMRGGTKIVCQSFGGNFTWLRARLERDPVANVYGGDQAMYLGAIDRILLNM